ncbi:MAG TPA: GNAT family N-acetyltransferase [Kofleriaceae bacterium]|nr:GNAT family N-acetyltransferase [Kofleriaceae bacterium]
MPRDLNETIILKDGGSILIRAIRPDDKARLADHFAHLGAESVRHRFFGAKRELTAKELAYYTECDQSTHVGLVATLGDQIIGVGRYLASGARAEVAFAIADLHQGRGIGTVLLEHLAQIARARGIEELEADVLADNRAMRDVFARSGFVTHETRDHDVVHVVFPIAQTEAFAAAHLERDRLARAASVKVFFEPRSIAIFGASRKPGGIGRAILANLRARAFPGPITVVSPSGEPIDGMPTTKILDTPVDLAIVAVPQPAVEGVVAQCAKLGVHGVVVITSGFAEVSPEGRAAQDRVLAIARGAGMRLVGPNCMGVLDTRATAPLDATFAPTWPPAGSIAMVSQSGALGLAMLDHASSLELGLSSFVSVGNKADVSSNDLLAYWADDPRTNVIALYLESFGNPRRFARIAPEVARKKPIVAIKSGRSAAGTRAAASHSAALASLDVGVDALFAQAGVVRTQTMEELFDVCALLAHQPVPAGARVGVVTNAGGPGILLADACEAHGLSLPSLDPTTRDALRALLPAAAAVGNPVDMTASAPPDHFARAIELVGNDPNVDSLVVIYIPPMVTEPESIAAAIARGAGTVPRAKPIASVFMSSRGAPAALGGGPRGRIPSYGFPEDAALALAAATRYGRWRARPRGAARTIDRPRARAIRDLVARVTGGATQPVWLAPDDVAHLLELAGVALAPAITAAPDAAPLAAERLGYPLAIKAIAPGLVHKSDVGGVILDVRDAAGVRDAVATLRARVPSLERVLVQRQVDGGVETLVGVTIDPSLGPIVVAGTGGVAVEILRDAAFRLVPVTDLDAREMLGELRGAKLLDGFRGAPPADRAALEEVITRISALAEELPELTDLEINPLRVLPRGAVALDARVRLAPR